MMAGAQGPFLAAVLLLVSSGLHLSSPLPSCPGSCTCQTAPLLNCSSAGLSLLPQQIQDSVTDLDLSHNLLDTVTLDRPHHNLRNVWLGNNTITRFSLCIRRSVYVRGRHLHRSGPWRGRGCVSWAPTLQLLSVERNQLEELPQGLEVSESLQVLQLSYNRISTLQPGDLSHLQKLKELHLQHNLIKSLHPQMFQDLVQLWVLDLSFNMLTSIHPWTYLTLRNIGADVDLSGNRWQCDCSMRSLRRQMAYDRSRGMGTWSVVCASPSSLSDTDLLQLEEDDLNCFSHENPSELHQDVTVISGSDIVLSCTPQDSKWWTPHGQASLSPPQAGLLISDISERDTGLYVCVSEEHEIVSVFNLQISQIGGARRKIRSLPRTSREIIPKDRPIGLQEKNQRATQSDLALAVCLSIFITFLIAFILGVLARPCVDVLWRRITKKESSSVANSVSSAERRQYDNEAYSNGEEVEHIGRHRERRVTFSNMEDTNVQYYDTVAGANQGSINSDAVIEYETYEAKKDTNRAGDSESEHSSQQSSPEDHQRDGRDLSALTDAGHTHNMEYEHIPDPDELKKRRSMSSGSDSSRSDKVINEEHMTPGDHSTPKTNQLAMDSLQRRSDFPAATKVEVPQISIEGTSELPGFSSEPFTDWSPHTNNLTDPDLWQENEEQFEFSDSVRSTSARSSGVHGSFNGSKPFVAPTFKKKTEDMSSSSSYVSEDEPTQYTVNSDQEQEVIERNPEKPKVTDACLKQDGSFEQQINVVNPITPSVGSNQGDYRYDTQRPAVRPEDSLSSYSSDSDQKDYIVKKGFVPSLAVTSHGKNMETKKSSPSRAYSSSSSSESEAETADLQMGQIKGSMKKWISEPETLSSDLDRQPIPQIKRHVNINAPLPGSDSSSSDESMETTHMTALPTKVSQTVPHDSDSQWHAVDLENTTRIKRHLDIKAPSPASDSSSSSDSEGETTNHLKEKEQGETYIAKPPIEVSQNVSLDLQTQWPALDLEHIPCIKRRLDIKAQIPPPDSSPSSNSEEETTKYTKKQKQGEMAWTPSKVSQTEGYEPQTQWPSVDLENTTSIKRRLDIKAPTPDSSSSSDSEDEKIHHSERPGKVDNAGLPLEDSQIGSHDQATRWPSLDLEHITPIKRRLDIKARSPHLDSSSSSDSEEETINYIQKQKQGDVSMTRPPSKVSPTAGYEPQTEWPSLDLEHNTSIKRRLDIKAPSPDSSSSSDSEDETTHTSERPGKVDIAGDQFQESQTGSHDQDTRWPAIDLEHIPNIKRHLNIKAPSPPLDSSSSSDSEKETINYIKKQKQEEVFMTRPPSTVSQTAGYEPQTQWPSLDLEHIPRIKRRLDIKARAPLLDSSSRSDSEKETTNYKKKLEQGEMSMTRPPSKVSQTTSYDPQTQWPSPDLEHNISIKRRLDIKAPAPPLDSSSSSDSEEETTKYIKKQEQGEMFMARPQGKASQTAGYHPQTKWPSLDLEHNTSIKRRLDIKAPSPDSSSSSDSEDEIRHHTKIHRPGVVVTAGLQESQTTVQDPETQWPSLDLGNITRLKRRLDIKAPSTSPDLLLSGGSTSKIVETERDKAIKMSPHQSSSSSDEQEAGMKDLRYPPTKGVPEPEPRLPTLDLSNTLHVKRRLDIKTHSPPPESSSSSDESEGGTTNLSVKVERVEMEEGITSDQPGRKLPDMNVSVPTVKRRLNIKGPSQTDMFLSSVSPGSVQLKSSSSSSEDESREPTKLGLGISAISKTNEIRSQKAPLINIPRNSKTDHYVKLENYTVITDEVGDKKTSDKVSTTPEINPELQSRWATMNLGVSRFRKRLEITSSSHEPPKLPSTPPPGSPSSSSSESETGSKSSRRTKAIGVGMQESSVSYETNYNVSLSAPQLRRSNSENEIIYHSVPDLSLGVPRIKRRLDIKAPLPEPSNSQSSSSESENEVARYTANQSGHVSNMSDLTDNDSIIMYKRLIIKSPSLPESHSFSSSDKGQNIDHTKQKLPSLSFDDIVKKRIQQPKHSTDVDLPPEIRWRRHLDAGLSSPKQALLVKPEHPPYDSSSSSSSESDDNTQQERGKADVTLMHKHSSLGASSVSPVSSRVLDKFDTPPSSTNEVLRAVSVDSKERKGLSALKAMSSERRKWDTLDEKLDVRPSPLFGDHGSQGDTSFNYHRSEKAIKSLVKQPQTGLDLSSISAERRATDLSYGIPRYRRHNIGGIEPPKEAPPPVPSTPPPYEAVVWRSTQSSKKQELQGNRSYLQQSRNTKESDPSLMPQNLAVYFDSSNVNISEV